MNNGGHSILCRHNEYHQILSVLDYLIKEGISNQKTDLEQLLDDLQMNQGENISQGQLDQILSALLSCIPDEIKNR